MCDLICGTLAPTSAGMGLSLIVAGTVAPMAVSLCGGAGAICCSLSSSLIMKRCSSVRLTLGWVTVGSLGACVKAGPPMPSHTSASATAVVGRAFFLIAASLQELLPEMIGYARHHPLESAREQPGNDHEEEKAEHRHGHRPEGRRDLPEGGERAPEHDEEQRRQDHDGDHANHELPGRQICPRHVEGGHYRRPRPIPQSLDRLQKPRESFQHEP